jgi:hypothetical protein
MATPRVAIVGLYRSGSSFWAGVCHHLGVDMGAPFWENDVDDHPDNHYEPWDLSIDLRRMWNEPLGEGNWSADDRRGVLKRWIMGRRPVAGAKHPLFCLMVDDILSAWGDDTVILWSFRPLEDSVDSLLRTTFPWSRLEMYAIQHKLWKAAHAHFRDRPPTLKLNALEHDEHGRAAAVDRLIDVLNLSPTSEQRARAVASFRKAPPNERDISRDARELP